MLLDLLHLPKAEFPGRAMTTGATGGNIIGLAIAREGIVDKVSGGKISIGELGLVEGLAAAGMKGIQVVTAGSHSSVAKAASVVGIGRNGIKELGKKEKMWEFDLERLKEELNDARRRNVGTVVVLGMGEVNSGRFPARGEVNEVKRLVDMQEGWAWLHIDTAFGGFVRILKGCEEEEWRRIAEWGEGLELADSMAGDNHKLLNAVSILLFLHLLLLISSRLALRLWLLLREGNEIPYQHPSKHCPVSNLSSSPSRWYRFSSQYTS